MTVKISRYQLAVLITMFEIGSTPLFALGSKAKQSSWISLSLAAICGALLLSLLLYMQRKEPELTLIELLRSYMGRAIGTLLGLSYIVYFAYESMRNLRDFGEIIQMTLLVNTPMFMIMLVVILMAVYAISLGMETLARLTEITLPILAISYFLLILLLLASGLVQVERVEPLLDEGWKPVLKAAFPDLISFPFGQMILFFMIWPLLGSKERMTRISMFSYGSVAAFLIVMNALNIMILGPVLVANSTVPLLQSVQLIQLAGILERLDIFVALLLSFGLFTKMALFYWGAVRGAHLIFGGKWKWWTLGLGALLYGTAFLEPSYTYHIWLGLDVSTKIFPVFQVAIPLLLLAVMLLRGPRRSRGPAENKS